MICFADTTLARSAKEYDRQFLLIATKQTLLITRNQKIVVLSSAVHDTFTSSEWTELGYLTDTKDWIDGHPRLLRSLHWGDSDYKGLVFEAIEFILDKNVANLKHLIEYPAIANCLKQNEPEIYQALLSEALGTAVEDVVPSNTTDSALAALADAQILLVTRGPMNAVDRIHTGLHGFLKSACDRASISYPSEPTANQLLKVLIEQHPALAELGPRSDDIRRMMRTSGSIVDAMGTLRNKASLAHPNDELLERDEALFVINLARSLIHFLDNKINK